MIRVTTTVEILDASGNVHWSVTETAEAKHAELIDEAAEQAKNNVVHTVAARFGDIPESS